MERDAASMRAADHRQRQLSVAGVAGAGTMLDEHLVGMAGRLHPQVLVAEAADQQALEAALERV